MIKQNLPGGLSAVVPPDPIPNSEVKRRCADGSVGLPHVRVGHRQVLNVEPRAEELGVFVFRFDFNKVKVRSKSTALFGQFSTKKRE